MSTGTVGTVGTVGAVGAVASRGIPIGQFLPSGLWGGTVRCVETTHLTFSGKKCDRRSNEMLGAGVGGYLVSRV